MVKVTGVSKGNEVFSAAKVCVNALEVFLNCDGNTLVGNVVYYLLASTGV